MTSSRGIVLSLLLLAVFAAAPAAAGPEPELLGGPAPGQDSASVVQARLRPESAKVAVGDTLRLTVEITIADGWHLYAHGDTSYYGIDLAAAAEGPVAPLRIDYPAGKETVLFGEKTRVLDGRLLIPVVAVVGPKAPLGRARLDLTLTVQACNDRLCLAPAFLPLPLRLEVRKGRAL